MKSLQVYTCISVCTAVPFHLSWAERPNPFFTKFLCLHIKYGQHASTLWHTSVNKSSFFSFSVPQSDCCVLCSSRRNFGDSHPFLKEKPCCPASLETEILSVLFPSSSRTGSRMLIKIPDCLYYCCQSHG